jgi:hypothetical protein
MWVCKNAHQTVRLSEMYLIFFGCTAMARFVSGLLVVRDGLAVCLATQCQPIVIPSLSHRDAGQTECNMDEYSPASGGERLAWFADRWGIEKCVIAALCNSKGTILALEMPIHIPGR